MIRRRLLFALPIMGAVLVSSLFLAATSVWALSFNNLVVFGDSLVDAGNVQNLAGGPGSLNDPAPASLGYFQGRFSNGPVASDFLNAAITGGNSVASTEGGSNYAFGGARARDNADFIPDLGSQLNIYLGGTGGVADANTLYFINAGGNDVRDILVDPNPTAVAASITSAGVSAIVTEILSLQAAGAQHFLVAGVGNVGGIPETIAFGPAAQAAGRAFSEAFNTALFAALPAGVATLDTIALFDSVLLNPALFGLPAGIDITNACIGTADAPTCNNHAFFDTIHPTTQVASILGDALISAVPEPGTGLLLMIGLSGLATRRHAIAA